MRQVGTDRNVDLPPHGSFEVGLVINADFVQPTLDQHFLRLLEAQHPNLTGWPLWLDSGGFSDDQSRPYVYEGGWETLIVNDVFDGVDFMRKEPRGHFYLYRALEDDFVSGRAGLEPQTKLEFGLTILRTAEAIAVGRAFAQALGCTRENATLEYTFRWTGLAGREISSWANPRRYISRYSHAVQDELFTHTTIPFDTPPDVIATATHKVVSQVFALFGGFSVSLEVVEDLVSKLLERRL